MRPTMPCKIAISLTAIVGGCDTHVDVSRHSPAANSDRSGSNDTDEGTVSACGPAEWDPRKMLLEAYKTDTGHDAVRVQLVRWAVVRYGQVHGTSLLVEHAVVALTVDAHTSLMRMYRHPEDKKWPVTWLPTSETDMPYVNQRAFDHLPTPGELDSFLEDSDWNKSLGRADELIDSGSCPLTE